MSVSLKKPVSTVSLSKPYISLGKLYISFKETLFCCPMANFGQKAADDEAVSLS